VHIRQAGKGRQEGTSMNTKHLTFVIFRQLGKVRRFVISSHLLLYASLFFLFYILATTYFATKYFDARRKNRVQGDQIARLSSELEETTKSLQRSKQRIALLQDYSGEDKAQGQEPNSKVDYTELPEVVGIEEVKVERDEKVDYTELPEVVGIEELKVERDESVVDVTFRIVNRQSNEEPIEGYIFVLASVKDSDQPQAWVYPRSPLKEGLPVDCRNGHRFFIWNFMSISSELRLGESIDKPLRVEILVYNKAGTLILKKAADVQNASWPF
jgi:hypothetical protein